MNFVRHLKKQYLIKYEKSFYRTGTKCVRKYVYNGPVFSKGKRE